MGWSRAELVDAVSYITGQASDKLSQLKDLAVWTWEVLQGDFNRDQDPSHVVANTAISIGVTMTGVGVLVAWLLDLRDFIANAMHIYQDAKDSKDNTLKFGRVSGMLWIALIATLIGVIPAVGDLAKGVLRIILIFFKRAMRATPNLSIMKAMAKAIDDAMPYIRELLARKQVQTWLKKMNWHRPFKELVRTFRKVKPLITKKKIMDQFDLFVKKFKEIVDSIVSYLPSGAAKKADELYKKLAEIRKGINDAIAPYIKPFQDCLDEIIIRLEKEDLAAYAARTGKLSDHYYGRVAHGSKAWQQARNSGYLVRAKAAPFPAAKLDDYKDEIAWATQRKGWEPISENNVNTFHKLYAKEIKGPKKLYRVVDPESRTDGMFWMTEQDFKALNSRTDWRSRSAVKEEWNANGQFVEYEIKAGETLKVWEGPAASQLYEGDLWYKGGSTQIVFTPNPSRVSSRKPTGWGYLDRDEHLLNEQVMIDLSGKKQ